MDECLLRHPDDSTPVPRAEGVSGLVNGGGWICTLSYWHGSRETELEICSLQNFLISLGEIIQQSLTRLFLQINNAINWIYSTQLTPDVQCIGLLLLRWNVLVLECLSEDRLASGGGWRINITFSFGLRRWQCEFQLPASAIMERSWWRKSHWKTFTRLWECALEVPFSFT